MVVPIQTLRLDERHVIHVAERPEPPTAPLIVRAHTLSLSVRNEHGVERCVDALHVSSGRVVELGPVLKSSIYGTVRRAFPLRRITRQDPEQEPLSEDAEYERTGESIAVKVYEKNRLRAMQGRTQEQPLLEIPTMQYLGNLHPNVMGQIECCSTNDSVYLLMRYVRGVELYDHVETHGAFDEHAARSLFRQMVSALSHLQRFGVAHRDLSLENVLYDGDGGICVVIDFGMALRLPRHKMDCIIDGVVYNESSLTPPSTPRSYWPFHCFIRCLPICGKPNYIAPEVQAQDAFFHPMLADMWALGVMLFIMLTGIPPVESAVRTDQRFKLIARGELPTLLAHWGISLSADAQDLLVRLLQAQPLARPSIEEVWAHAWLRDEEQDES